MFISGIKCGKKKNKALWDVLRPLISPSTASRSDPVDHGQVHSSPASLPTPHPRLHALCKAKKWAQSTERES